MRWIEVSLWGITFTLGTHEHLIVEAPEKQRWMLDRSERKIADHLRACGATFRHLEGTIPSREKGADVDESRDPS